jgi:hypothetical protein
MRQFITRYRWPLLGAATLLAVALVAALGASVLRRGPVSSAKKARVNRGIGAFEGVGAWIDLWDTKAWRDPSAAVADMDKHGVKTIYLQTGNPRSPQGISNPDALAAFITEAHKRDMFVVAWYLPNLKTGSADLEHVVAAVDFETSDGDKVDSFALDIESTAVKPVSKRNRNLATLTKAIRTHVGPKYALGGIIPSPVGIAKQTGFWNTFPYGDVARDYDVVLPMAYYTFDAHNPKEAAAYATSSMQLLRAQPGCSDVPVHLIGGIASGSSSPQMRAFAKAARQSGSIGISMYDWAGMSPGRWTAQDEGWNAE